MEDILETQQGLPSGTVTFLLTDVEGSSRLWERTPVAAALAMARHHEILDEVVTACHGSRPLEQGEGDSIVAVFARASDGLRAARLAQEALAAEPWPDDAVIRVRMALHTGEAELKDDGTYAGAVLNRCARLRALAHGAQVVVSDSARDMVLDHLDADVDLIDLGVHRLRDLGRPERVWQLAAPGLLAEHPPLRSLDSVPNNLPVQLSSFIGRDEDIERAASLLAETRLLTLSGSGGCGKTRLAQRVAAEVIDRFPDGVWWVELASITDGDLVAEVLGGVMALRTTAERSALDSVVAHLCDDRALIVLDNCEHLIASCAIFTDALLRGCSEVVVLATSREPLVVEGEVTWRVPSLAVPPEVMVEPETVGQYDAVKLFIDRAVQARPNFAVTNANAPAVAQICHRLDGIPLALELAAARTRVLPVEQIASELDDRFRLLAGGSRSALPRQQALLASIDWSHDLLDSEERALLRRLGVFVGGFNLDACEAVGEAEPLDRYGVLDVLTRLVDKSLVQLEEGSAGSARYRLLESIRQYAETRLDEAGEGTSTRERHLMWAIRYAGGHEAGATNAHVEALEALEGELPNLRAALEFAIGSHRSEDALVLVASLCFFWAQHGHYTEAASWTAQALNLATGPSAYAARARWAGAYTRYYGADFEAAAVGATEALAEARAVGDEVTEARSLHTLGTADLLADPPKSRECYLAAVDLARRAGDRWCEADTTQMLAYSYLVQANMAEARPYLEASARMAEELNNDFQRSWHQIALGWFATWRGDFDAGRSAFAEGIALAHRVGDPAPELYAHTSLALLELRCGHPAAAAPIAAGLADQRREWGGFGDLFIPAIKAVSEVGDAPAQASAVLAMLATAAIDGGDTMDGTLFLGTAALAALEVGDAGTALAHAQAAVAASAKVGGTIGSGSSAVLAGIASRLLGDRTAAEASVHEGLQFQLDRMLRSEVADSLEALGGIAVDAESFAEAARLLAAGEALRRELGQIRLPAAQARFDDDARAVCEALGADHDSVWSEGAALGWLDACAYARRARGERRRPSFGWDSLTPTELSVVALAADGLTNPEICERLFISRGTVKTHLGHAFAKLGVKTRAELASVATKHALS